MSSELSSRNGGGRGVVCGRNLDGEEKHGVKRRACVLGEPSKTFCREEEWKDQVAQWDLLTRDQGADEA